MSKSVKQTLIFPINIEPCEEGGFFADCPVLQGCHAEGETYGEAIDNITDVIKAHVEIKRKHGEIIPFVKVGKLTDISVQFPLPVGPISVGQTK